jgi:hypothetical protein
MYESNQITRGTGYVEHCIRITCYVFLAPALFFILFQISDTLRTTECYWRPTVHKYNVFMLKCMAVNMSWL